MAVQDRVEVVRTFGAAVRRLAVASSVIVVLGCGGAGRCSGPKPAVDSGDPSVERNERALRKRPEIVDPANLTEAEVDALAAWLVPYVEEAGGATFTTRPKGELGTVENLADVLEGESLSILGRIYDLPPEVLQRMAEESRQGIPGLLGKYASSTGSVYLVPSGVAAMSEGLGDEVGAVDVATLIMAHELGHALQDQVGDLDRVFGELEDLDHFDGMRGITEGQANWITLRVARELGLEDAFWVLSASQGWGPDGLLHPGAFDIWMLYGQGMAFSEHHAQIGGTEALWDMVKHPPRSTTMLFRPERYARQTRHPKRVGEALRGVEQALTRTPDWLVADTHLGEAPLRKRTLGLDSARVDKVLDAIEWGHERRLSVPTGASVAARNGSLMILKFSDAAQANALVDLLSDGLEKQAEVLNEAEVQAAKIRGTQPATWSVETRPYDKVEGDSVIRRVVGPNSPSGARDARQEEQALWVVRGDVLVVVSVSGFRPGNRLDKATRQLFEQIESTDLGLEAAP